MNATEFRTGFALVTKIMVDMICGPANMVRARGKIARFMVSSNIKPSGSTGYNVSSSSEVRLESQELATWGCARHLQVRSSSHWLEGEALG